ncbi:unnamed protein product [Rangifer tarandus platyrhynchus]|uniref:Uncharacterized protein n=1 Tax=Rangifer tarandus platyrhynchus TaxID=3082113 RepID=A0ABN9A5M3_RANTA|nr:unnamed protein product [Rangifer tarandus platyrhynchus]
MGFLIARQAQSYQTSHLGSSFNFPSGDEPTFAGAILGVSPRQAASAARVGPPTSRPSFLSAVARGRTDAAAPILAPVRFPGEAQGGGGGEKREERAEQEGKTEEKGASVGRVGAASGGGGVEVAGRGGAVKRRWPGAPRELRGCRQRLRQLWDCDSTRGGNPSDPGTAGGRAQGRVGGGRQEAGGHRCAGAGQRMHRARRAGPRGRPRALSAGP